MTVHRSLELLATLLLTLTACGPDPVADADADADAGADADADADADPDGDGDADGDSGGHEFPDREPGVRAPLTAACGDEGMIRCLLPWPSSAFTTADPGTATGLRVAVEAGSLAVEDDPGSLALADGFSRVSPLMAGFEGALGPAQGAVHLFLAQHDHPRVGEEVPLHVEVVVDERPLQSLVVAYPLRPLEPGADYVAVVTRALTDADGAPLEPTRASRVALGVVVPATDDERRLAAYHAPTRSTLAAAGVAAEDVVVVWDFTTRSLDDPTRWLVSMIATAEAAVAAGEVTVEIDEVAAREEGTFVEGRLVGLPLFVGETGLALDAAGAPVAMGSGEAPFRVAIPPGAGDYRFVMYGHGTGGTFDDSSFDAELLEQGVAKVGVEWHGWTDTQLIATLTGLDAMLSGTFMSTSWLLQAVADAAAIEEALAGPLGDALAAETLGGQPNPAAGRRPDPDTPVWAGGSLGGTMGFVYAAAQPDIRHGVLNVPGAAWTHFIPASVTWEMIKLFIEISYGGPIDMIHALHLSQINWDPVDGTSWVETWAAKGGVFLIQESMGDPVLPNPGSAMVAVATDAVQVGAVLEPLTGLTAADEAVGRSGLTQYRVPQDWSDLDIHGFAADDTPAGEAAREQIRSFFASVWAGEPLIVAPSGCAGGSCDFSGL